MSSAMLNELWRLVWLCKQRPGRLPRGAELHRVVQEARQVLRHPVFYWDGVKVCLAFSEFRLIVYGTLIPGGEFHHLLADLPAVWEVCAIRGYMGTYRGYKAFKWNPHGPEHQAWLVTSVELPERLKILDRFEGRAYVRRLIPARVGTCLVVAWIYEGRRFA